jgi:hypothetical protein
VVLYVKKAQGEKLGEWLTPAPATVIDLTMTVAIEPARGNAASASRVRR